MSNPGDADATPITSVRQLAEHIAAGCKPRENFAIGTEHEKFGFRFSDFTPPPYEPRGIRAVLEAMEGGGWTPILDAGNPIGLARDRASVSLEPAGQLELSGATLETLHETADELAAHLAHVRRAAEPLGLGFVPLGFHPTMRRDQMPWMPKGRYAIMRRYMPKVGSLGLDMMTRTCTVQVNLDYESEADMVRKLQVSLALQPVATALFANSPFTEGRPNGYLSVPRACLVRHRQPAFRDAARFLCGGFRVRAVCGMAARRADVFRGPRRRLCRHGRMLVPRFHRGPAAAHRRGRGHCGRLRGSHDHGVYRCAAEAVSGDARRGCRQSCDDGRAIGVVGRAAVRPADTGGGARPGAAA